MWEDRARSIFPHSSIDTDEGRYMSPADEASTGEVIEKITFQKIWKDYGIIAVFLIFFIFLSILSRAFFTFNNQINVLRQVSILGIVSLGVFTTLIAGNLDLSVGSVLGFISAACAGLAKNIGPAPAFTIVLLIALSIGFTNGFLSTRGKNLSIMVTLSMKFIIYSGTLLVTRTKPIVNLPNSLLFLGIHSFGSIPLPVILLILVTVFFWFFTSQTKFGRWLYAVGSNDVAARFSGLAIKKLQIFTFMISAVCAALAGIILMGRVSSAQPNAGVGMELDAIGAVLIGGASLTGGRGTIRGTIVGVLIFGLINNGLNLLGVDVLFRDAAKGAMILFAILMDQWGRE
jgi:ribose transport system permease protein